MINLSTKSESLIDSTEDLLLEHKKKLPKDVVKEIKGKVEKLKKVLGSED